MKRALQLAVLAIVVGVFTLPAQAATINVFAGEVAVNAGNGKCSLREAIANAEADSDTSGNDCVAGSGSDTIVLASDSTYSLLDQYSPILGPPSGLPTIRSTIVINGNGATIERSASLFSGTACGGAGAKFRILFVAGDGNLTLNNLTLKNGCASGGAGGAIFNHGTLSLVNTTVTNNEASNSGGAIHNNGTLTLTQSTVSNSSATSGAGGGIVNRGTMQVVQSTISGNSTVGAGGGVEIGGSTTGFANSTLSGNLSDGNGGGIFNSGPTTITNSTIALNRGARPTDLGASGSGIYRKANTVTLTNSLVAQQLNGTNCSSVNGVGNNLDDDGSCPTATVSATPLIGALANYGGPTLTHPLLTGSPAIDAGNITICNASPVNGVDQRGVTRPQGLACDIGAFEYATYGVTYNGNTNTSGNVPTDGNAYAISDTVTVLGNTGSLVKTGYTFAGWNTAANGSGTAYAASATFTIAANTTLYAQWTINTYTVTYNGNGNTGGSAPVDGSSPYNYNATVTVLGAGSLTRTGYTFAGWNTAANGSRTSYSAGNTFPMPAANVTLYAQWTINNSYTAPSATGTGTITASFTGGGAGCGFTVSQFIPLTGNAASPPAGSAPDGVSFPQGLFDFTVSGCTTPGGVLNFTITYPQALPPGTQYWKYGPTSTNSTPHWYVLPAVISGNIITFSITDGGLGDDDLAANGTIVDQGGPGVLLVPVPALSVWALALLALLLLGFGARRVRCRR